MKKDKVLLILTDNDSIDYNEDQACDLVRYRFTDHGPLESSVELQNAWDVYDSGMWLRDYFNVKSTMGKTLYDEFKSQNKFSYWLSNFTFEYLLHRKVLFPFKTALELIDKVTPNQIILPDGSSDIEKAIILIANHREINIKILTDLKSKKEKRKRHILLRIKSKLSKLTSNKIQNLSIKNKDKVTLNNILKEKQSKGHLILMVSQRTNIRNYYDPAKDKEYLIDIQFNNLIPHLTKDMAALLLYNDFNFQASKTPSIGRLLWTSSKNKKKEHDMITSNKSDEINNLKEVLGRLKNDKHLIEQANIDGINIWELIVPFLDWVWLSIVPHTKYEIELNKQILNDIRPSLIITGCEYGQLRPLYYSAKILGIPIVGTQHGIIHPYHLGYMLSTHWMSDELKDDIRKSILPDFTFVDGMETYNLLTEESIYKKDKVLVTGRAWYDSIIQNQGLYDVAKIKNKLGLSSNKKTILYITQPIIDSIERDLLTRTILSSISTLKDEEILVKVHPGESISFYNEILEQMEIKAMVTKDADLYKCLAISNMMIHSHSTVGYEALLMNVPFVSVRISGKPDISDYVKEGVSLGAHNTEEIISAASDILYENWKPDQKIVLRYLEGKLGMLDGKAGIRIADAIFKLLD